MFCSKCGKTLTMEDQQCPHCGNPIGESRFEGTPYTSAQAHILPNAPIKQATAAYTRTTYTTMPEERKQEGDVDSRTTYRPVYEGASAPEEIRRDMRAAVKTAEQPQESPEQPAAEKLSDEARDTLNAVDEELKMEDIDTSELRSRPIESTGRAGISAGVEDYIHRLEANQSRKAARRRRNYDDGLEEGAYTAPEGQAVYDDIEGGGPDDGQDGVFDDIGEDEFDEMRYGRTLGLKDILKVALIMVLAAALIVGGVLWFRHIRTSSNGSSRIEGVNKTLYEDGIALVKSHTEKDYISDLISVYAAEGNVGFVQRVSADSDVIDGLLPKDQEPTSNESLFVSVLQTIQSNIGNAILLDATAAANGDTGGEAESAARWGIVNNSIAQLENATQAAELTAILNGEQVTVTAAEPTPEPTPEPANYATLQKGDKSDAVMDLQNRLYMLGFLLDDRDGAFGNKTQTAVKLFQSAAGLEVTGIADSATQNALYADDAPRTEYAQATPEPTPEPTPEAPASVQGADEAAAEAGAADEAAAEGDAAAAEADVG